MNTIITIGRQFGSGGKEIGKGLAEALGIPFYDEEIVKMVAESGDMHPDTVKEAEEKVCTGVYIEKDVKSMPATLERLTDDKVYLTIQEGKFHQVKKMFHAVGVEVIYLKRISMGGLKLDENLKEGDFRPLTQEEIDYLKGLTNA